MGICVKEKFLHLVKLAVIHDSRGCFMSQVKSKSTSSVVCVSVTPAGSIRPCDCEELDHAVSIVLVFGVFTVGFGFWPFRQNLEC